MGFHSRRCFCLPPRRAVIRRCVRMSPLPRRLQPVRCGTVALAVLGSLDGRVVVVVAEIPVLVRADDLTAARAQNLLATRAAARGDGGARMSRSFARDRQASDSVESGGASPGKRLRHEHEAQLGCEGPDRLRVPLPRCVVSTSAPKAETVQTGGLVPPRNRASKAEGKGAPGGRRISRWPFPFPRRVRRARPGARTTRQERAPANPSSPRLLGGGVGTPPGGRDPA